MMQHKARTSFFVIWVAASAATAGLLFGYDVAVMNGALIFLRTGFNLSSLQTELLTSMLFWGCAAGAALGGWASDRFGRRLVLFIAGALFCVATLTAACSKFFLQLSLGRLLAGVAVGAALLIAPLYIAEIAPANARGRLVTLNQLATVSGILLGFLCNYQLAQLPHDNWRWMFSVAALPALALCTTLCLIPESPRWLLQRGQRDRAVAVLRKIMPESEVDAELNAIGTAILDESGSYRELLGVTLRKPLVLAILLAVIQQVTGINTVLYYGAIIFQEHTGASTSQAIGMNVLVGIVNLVFTIIGLLLIDKLGRRPLLLSATGGMGLCLVAFGAVLHYMPGHWELSLVPLLGYVACFAFGLGTGVWVCLAEMFPNRIRGRAMSVATMALWISVSGVTATFLSFIRILSTSGVFLGYAFLCVVSFVYIFFSLPETKNCTLEEIESIWSRRNA